MNGLFCGCFDLEEVNLINFDTGNVENFNQMFLNCFNLNEIKGLEKFIGSKAKTCSEMFRFCKSLKEINISNFDLRNATDIKQMFYFCLNLRGVIGLEKLNTSKVENISYMFGDCRKIHRFF